MDWIAFAKVAAAVLSFPLFHISFISGKMFMFDRKVEIDGKMVPTPLLYKVYSLMMSLATAGAGLALVKPICDAIGLI